MAIRIRPLAAKDKTAWLPLFRGYIEFYEATVADDIIEATWQRMIDGEPDFHVGLVAVGDDDRPVGLAHILFHRSTWSKTHYCYLEDLFVEPTLRAGGIGRALIEAVYREADARGCDRTYWMTQEFNYRARSLRSDGDENAVRAVPALIVRQRLATRRRSHRSCGDD